MSSEEILAAVSFALAIAAYLFGRIYPKAKKWDYVDVAYYPLGILGVLLFFASSNDSRQRCKRLRELAQKY